MGKMFQQALQILQMARADKKDREAKESSKNMANYYADQLEGVGPGDKDLFDTSQGLIGARGQFGEDNEGWLKVVTDSGIMEDLSNENKANAFLEWGQKQHPDVLKSFGVDVESPDFNSTPARLLIGQVAPAIGTEAGRTITAEDVFEDKWAGATVGKYDDQILEQLKEINPNVSDDPTTWSAGDKVLANQLIDKRVTDASMLSRDMNSAMSAISAITAQNSQVSPGQVMRNAESLSILIGDLEKRRQANPNLFELDIAAKLTFNQASQTMAALTGWHAEAQMREDANAARLQDPVVALEIFHAGGAAIQGENYNALITDASELLPLVDALQGSRAGAQLRKDLSIPEDWAGKNISGIIGNEGEAVTQGDKAILNRIMKNGSTIRDATKAIKERGAYLQGEGRLERFVADFDSVFPGELGKHPAIINLRSLYAATWDKLPEPGRVDALHQTLIDDLATSFYSQEKGAKGTLLDRIKTGEIKMKPGAMMRLASMAQKWSPEQGSSPIVTDLIRDLTQQAGIAISKGGMTETNNYFDSSHFDKFQGLIQGTEVVDIGGEEVFSFDTDSVANSIGTNIREQSSFVTNLGYQSRVTQILQLAPNLRDNPAMKHELGIAQGLSNRPNEVDLKPSFNGVMDRLIQGIVQDGRESLFSPTYADGTPREPNSHGKNLQSVLLEFGIADTAVADLITKSKSKWGINEDVTQNLVNLGSTIIRTLASSNPEVFKEQLMLAQKATGDPAFTMTDLANALVSHWDERVTNTLTNGALQIQGMAAPRAETNRDKFSFTEQVTFEDAMGNQYPASAGIDFSGPEGYELYALYAWSRPNEQGEVSSKEGSAREIKLRRLNKRVAEAAPGFEKLVEDTGGFPYGRQ